MCIHVHVHLQQHYIYFWCSLHIPDPIPGGCAQTSALEYEAAITPYYNPQSTTIYFQVTSQHFSTLVLIDVQVHSLIVNCYIVL